MKLFRFIPAALLLAICISSVGCSNQQSATPQNSEAGKQEKAQVVTRPPIVGVAHIGLRTDNLAAARKFYTGFLGFQEPFTVDDPPGKLLLTYFKVNDHQYIEVFPRA